MENRLELMDKGTERRFSEAPLSSEDPCGDPIGYQLILELQSTLNIEKLLEIFFHHLKREIPCQSQHYISESLDLDLREGARARHRAEYQLLIGGEHLGTIRFHRRHPFTEKELARIEALLGVLVLPLRNAVHYRQALRAASHDPLTGLKNRRAFEDDLEREISRARREQQRLGLMVIDVDRFKQINDQIGHLAGDQVLAEVARALKSSVRRSDMVFRYAGDEFVLLLPNIDDTGVRILEERLHAAIAALRCVYGDQTIPVSITIGTAILDQGEDGKALFEKADLAMLYNKESHHRHQAAAVSRTA